VLLQYAPGLPPTMGLVEKHHAVQYWDACNRLGINAVSLHLAGYLAPQNLLKSVGDIIRLKKEQQQTT